MYNFSQALSQGSVKLIDWKSIQNANMDTVEFREQAIKAAIAQINKNQDIDTNFTISPKIFDALTDSTKQIFSENLSTIITEEMYGKEFTQNKQLILSMNNLMAVSYSSILFENIL